MKPLPGGPLPIDAVLGELLGSLASTNRLVLQAAPGAGKSTRVPLAVLTADWLVGRKVALLEPRRLAARSVASRMAFLLGESVGDTVGYRMRGDTRVGRQTRIEVLTEGVLGRMLLRDPSLDEFGAVFFDEFHERSLHADFGLALALQTQEVLRPDLRLVVMSATIDGAAVSAVMRGARVVTSPSRSFPVDVRYVSRSREISVEAAVASVIRRALATDDGSILAFLPGKGEIRRCLTVLDDDALPDDVRVWPLYGDLGLEAQDAALRPPAAGERKVVLATSIAETSLTIDGVRVVIDGGASRTSRFSAQSGMSRLVTVRTSRASADQRAGRAGRTAAGVCYRLWAEEEHAALPERSRPEILDADLSPLALDLAVAGVVNADDLHWLDIPPVAALAHARALLIALGALDAHHRITPHGLEIATLGIHPRLAHMLRAARERGFGGIACVLAAVLEERDFLQRDAGPPEPDLRLRVDAVLKGSRAAPPAIRARASTLRSLLSLDGMDRVDESRLGECVALAYPDRVAQQRGTKGRYRLRNGTGAMLPGHGALWREEFLAVAELDGRSPDARIFLAAPIARSEILALFAPDLFTEEVIAWSARDGIVSSLHREMFGALVLHEGGLAKPDQERVANALVAAIRARDGLELCWPEPALQLRQRVEFLRRSDRAWPDWSDPALDATLESWLLPHLVGLRRRADVERLPLHDILLDTLAWEQRRDLDRLAPTHVTVPTGSRVRVDYRSAESPRIAVRLQELFGLEQSPRIADGRIALTIEMLSPAHRPVQVTNDLAGFWRNSYFNVRKELRGRYPRHEWPEDPLGATPTRRAKPRS